MHAVLNSSTTAGLKRSLLGSLLAMGTLLLYSTSGQ